MGTLGSLEGFWAEKWQEHTGSKQATGKWTSTVWKTNQLRGYCKFSGSRDASRAEEVKGRMDLKSFQRWKVGGNKMESKVSLGKITNETVFHWEKK